MPPIAYIFMSFGAVLAVVGVILFAKMGVQGASSIKMFGFEFQLGGSALVVVVVGALLFVVPVLFKDELSWSPPAQPQADKDIQDQSSSSGPDSAIEPTKDTSRPATLPVAAKTSWVIVDNVHSIEKPLDFADRDHCLEQIPEGANSEYSCELVQGDVWCLRSHNSTTNRTKWECFTGLDNCEIWQGLLNLADAPVESPCASYAISDAILRLRSR